MSNNLNSYAIIIPAYNEAGRISSTLAGIRKFTDADIIVVNDGSDDDTASEARKAGVVVIELSSNLSYGAALQTGFKFALDKGYEFAVQMDADGQHDPLSMEALISPVLKDEVDVVIGSRFLDKGNYKAPFIRRMGMYFFGFITSILTGRKITDPTSGFQALNKKVMEFYASGAYPVDYPDADVIIMLHRQGFRFKEVPVIMHNAAKNLCMAGFLNRCIISLK